MYWTNIITITIYWNKNSQMPAWKCILLWSQENLIQKTRGCCKTNNKKLQKVRF